MDPFFQQCSRSCMEHIHSCQRSTELNIAAQGSCAMLHEQRYNDRHTLAKSTRTSVRLQLLVYNVNVQVNGAMGLSCSPISLCCLALSHIDFGEFFTKMPRTFNLQYVLLVARTFKTLIKHGKPLCASMSHLFANTICRLP